MRVVTALICASLIVAILHDAFEVILLPRRVKSKTRIVRYFFKGTWRFWSGVGRRIASEDRRHSFLGLYGPLSLVLLLVVWAVGIIGGFGGIFWSLNPAQFGSHQWLNHTYFSGVTFFTLGYGDIVPHAAWSKVLAVFEAGTGLGFIAMVIGYLPVLYQLFSRRETQVIMLDSIAGSPPDATTMLCRYADGHGLDALDGFLLRWQQWAAELLESQLSYPMLTYYRSQHDNQSWLAALTVIMDASVLIMVGLEGVRTLQAQMTFATARLAVIEMGRVLEAGPRASKKLARTTDSRSAPKSAEAPLSSGGGGSRPVLAFEEERLSSRVFADIRDRLAAAGLRFVDEAEAEEKLAAFRDTYEPFLSGLADHLLLPLPGWSSNDDQLDNWMNSPRGKSAKRLIESVESEPGTSE